MIAERYLWKKEDGKENKIFCFYPWLRTGFAR